MTKMVLRALVLGVVVLGGASALTPIRARRVFMTTAGATKHQGPPAARADAVGSRRGLFRNAFAVAVSASASVAALQQPARAEDEFQTDPGSSQVCAKRGPLGRCDEYQQDGQAVGESASELTLVPRSGEGPMTSRQAKLLEEMRNEQDGNELTQQLLAKSAQNKERWTTEVTIKSFENSEAGMYGPFAKVKPVRKLDGKYELLKYKDYDRLKKSGDIVDDAWVR